MTEGDTRRLSLHIRVGVYFMSGCLLKKVDCRSTLRYAPAPLRIVEASLPHARNEPWLRLWVDRCQAVAGRVGEVEPLIVVAEIRWLYANLPRIVGVVEQCLLRSLLGLLVSRLLRVHRVENQPSIAAPFFEFASSGLSGGAWQRRFQGLLDICDVVLSSEAISGLGHVQVERALCAIQDRYTDPLLNLDAVAKEVGSSASQVTRLLKLHTSHGFLGHLHRRRSTAAHRLLIESGLSVKEIAAAVGYRSVTQLGRHFKRYTGSTPASVRTASMPKTRAS
jgi:AraC-like DNA-binding protein